MPDVVHDAVIQAVIRADTPLEFMLATMRDVSQPMPFRAEIAKAAAPYVHPKLAATEISVNKAPPDNRSLQEKWEDLVRAMMAAGAITLVPEDHPGAIPLPAPGRRLVHTAPRVRQKGPSTGQIGSPLLMIQPTASFVISG